MRRTARNHVRRRFANPEWYIDSGSVTHDMERMSGGFDTGMTERNPSGTEATLSTDAPSVLAIDGDT
jgi:hypothetical protein